MDVKTLGWDEFAALYCATQEQTPEGLASLLRSNAKTFQPEGFLIAECQVLGSRWPPRIILPYGGSATLPSPPEGFFSPRGLASDQSVVIALLPIDGLGAA